MRAAAGVSNSAGADIKLRGAAEAAIEDARALKVSFVSAEKIKWMKGAHLSTRESLNSFAKVVRTVRCGVCALIKNTSRSKIVTMSC